MSHPTPRRKKQLPYLSDTRITKRFFYQAKLMDTQQEKTQIPPHIKEIIEEEESLALRVNTELMLAAKPDNSDAAETADAAERIKTLRDEAISARGDDLSALFDQLHNLRVVTNRTRPTNLPDLDSPYFAHLRVEENDKERDYLLGRATFIEAKSGIRIVDWRHAPIAKLFYLYREGDEFEENLPGRVARGTIIARRVVAFREGRLMSLMTPDFTAERRASGEWALVDEATRQMAGGQGTAVRGTVPDVTALLDKEQYAALEEYETDPLLIMGGAGSGKTTVALHRAARLAYEKDHKRFAANKMKVLVPEPGLAKLTNRVLGWLGAPGIKAQTLTQFCKEEVFRLAPKLPQTICDTTPSAVAKLKQHPALLDALMDWIDKKPRRYLDLKQDRAELLTDKGLLEDVVNRANGELPKSAALETVKHTLRQLAKPTEDDYKEADEDRLVALDGQSLDAGTDDDIHQTIDEEDLPLLLEIAHLRLGYGKKRKNPILKELGEIDAPPIFDHLVIDEAQEYSAVELAAMSGLLSPKKSMTIAGDEAQRMDAFSTLSTWQARLAYLGVPEADIQELTVSYRSSVEIAMFAHQVLGPEAPDNPPNARRKGAPVGRFLFGADGALALFMIEKLQSLIQREPDASIAILTRTQEGANNFAKLLEHVPEARQVEGGDFSFKPGIDICTVTDAKGLEFDYVILPDVDDKTYPSNPESRRTLHVAATRAIHQLWVLAYGRYSPNLPTE
jgi:DNA helicase-2/ATP-dependent DNA helicase PcrA